MMSFASIFFFLLAITLNAMEPISPIPQSIPHNPIKAALGKKLFFDPILSKNGTIACVSCHRLNLCGTDGARVSTGINDRQGVMNAPTVCNSVFNFRQFWNGRAKNLLEQTSGPIHNPIEMGMSAALVEEKLNKNSYYQTAFAKITGHQKVAFNDVADALAEYEKTLITPNSKFDRYLRHEVKLSPNEEAGYKLFKNMGCASCHNGVNVGGNSFQKFGVIVAVPRDKAIDDRYAITKREQDKHVFKVPSLRNIALTGPYFHDGRALNLTEAITIMSYHNLGVPITIQEVSLMTAFLHTLTGKLPKND
jgi:cytochrome c peroxidase